MIYKMFPFHLVEDETMAFVDKFHKKHMIDDQPVNVDWDYYRAISYTGNAVVVFAMDKEVEGVAGYQVTTDPNDKDKFTAYNIIFSLKKNHRRKSGEFLEKCNEFLKSIGVSSVEFSLCNKKIARFLKMKGFDETSVILGCEL